LLIALTACGTSDNEENNNTSTGEDTGEKVLNFINGDTIPSMDPSMVTDEYGFQFIGSTMEGLYRLDENVPVDIGYGLGLTAKQSEVNAKIAVETCSKTEDSKCYIVNERQETIGPIGVKKEFDASRLYHALIHNARLNNELSYNFIDFIRTRNNEPFSSNDIANYYNVTKRSAERTVNKLLNGEVIKVSGEERPYQKGRPRKLFTLNQ